MSSIKTHSALQFDYLSSSAAMSALAQCEGQDCTFHDMPDPMVLAKAEGSTIWDLDGKAYLDLCGGFGTLALGHNPPYLRALFKELSEQNPAPMIHSMGDVYPSISKIKLLTLMQGFLAPRLTRGSLALGGGQAIEIAIKTAVLNSKKSGFIAFKHSYHGLDLGILKLSSREDFRVPFEKAMGELTVQRLPYNKSTAEDFRSAVKSLEASGAGFAGVILEPLQGRGGMIPGDPKWLKDIGVWTHEHQGLLILDEILTGLGRIGQLSFAQELEADMSAFGKIIGGSMPLSALWGTEDVMKAWPKSGGEAIHTGTFFGHALACEAGYRCLDTIIKEDWPQLVTANGASLKAGLWELFKNVPNFKEVTGQGLLIGVHFKKQGQGAEWMHHLKRQGIITLAGGPQGDVLSFSPAFNLSTETILAKLGEADLKL